MRLTRRGVIRSALGSAATLVLGGAGTVPLPVPRPDRVPPAAALNRAPVPMHQSGVAGWMLTDLASGAVLDARAPDHAFVPASVAKLPTAVYALERLGPDFRFETRVAVTGKVGDGVLEGDLVLVGGGDPELDSDALEPLAAELRARGIRRVAGRFLVDGMACPRAPGIADDQPVDAAYNPAVSGLNLNFNRVRLKWDARGSSRLLRISAKGERLDPDIAGVRVALAAHPDGPMFSHSLERDAEVWQMNPRGFRGEGARWLPVRRPELYAGEVFRTLAAGAGVQLGPPLPGALPDGAAVVARHESRPLAVMLRYMLRYSTNLTAEMTGLAATRAAGLAPASLVESAAAMNAWAAGYAGFAPGDPGFRLVNHSGLATESRVSPRRLVEFLTACAARHEAVGERHPQLPDGAIQLLRDYNVAAKSVKLDYDSIDIAAKTGTMDYVRGLAGYIVTPKGRKLAFAVFSNDIDRRPPDPARAIDRRWMAQSKVFERGLVRHWITTADG